VKFKGAGLKLVTSGKVTGAASVRLSEQSKGQCNLQVQSSSFFPKTSTILTFLWLGVSGIFLLLLIRGKKIPPSIWRLRELENIYLCLKLGYWSTRPVKDKVPKFPGHASQLLCHIAHIFECVLIYQLQHRITATSQRTQDSIALQDDNEHKRYLNILHVPPIIHSVSEISVILLKGQTFLTFEYRT